MAQVSATGSSVGGAGGDSEGEEQEDPSSSSPDEVLEVGDSLKKLNVQDETQNANDELAAFRQQWQRELEANATPKKTTPPKQKQFTEPISDEEKAKQLFLSGIEMERRGRLYEAIQHYKYSLQILPDVEKRLHNELQAEIPEEEVIETEDRVPKVVYAEDDEEEIEGEDRSLASKFRRILELKGALCEPELETRDAHISWLPYEVVIEILRWVVSSELDVFSLDQVSNVCRGLYVAAREPAIWRSLCVNTWGVECDTVAPHPYISWRQMYMARPRVHLHGVYISKTTYVRHGDKCYQNEFYQSWFLIDYYRYIRFFADGTVLMWTTPDEPQSCVSHLKNRQFKHGLGIMPGHYRVVGEKVVIVVKRVNQEKKPVAASNTRFRSRHKEIEQQQEQTFHVELELSGSRSARNSRMEWRHYAACTRRDQWTQFELTPGKFPPFRFSRVRSYMAEAEAPLPTCYNN
ncbi:hypothetical protein HW555_010563 [Spodoptera exigua]|uniref:F-box only protein 9 n=1 Tax=Spodoptera exigua TaxID=7107 RepID=A0A835L0T1_SPOEX|nr:hypothetical protein HW555_010563 [Spodoptera exigua]